MEFLLPHNVWRITSLKTTAAFLALRECRDNNYAKSNSAGLLSIRSWGCPDMKQGCAGVDQRARRLGD
jgi:hypothetical protein